LAIIVAGGYLIAFSSVDSNERKEAVARGRSFSMERLLENRGKGKVSVVKFTADWCPNCMLVEKTSLHTAGVERLMSLDGVELLTADLTADNPPAQRLLERLGSRSIPFLALFPPGAEFNEPYCLRDIYSEKQVIEAIKRSLRAAPASDINSIRFDRPQQKP
jgi:thiol:disulfide interchange protein DsbD